MIPDAVWHCHVLGLHSIVLAKHDDGRPSLRMFTTDKSHDLWMNEPCRLYAGQPMSLAAHAHRANLRLSLVRGLVLQVTFLPGHHELVSLRQFHYRSHLLTGSGGFTATGETRKFRVGAYRLTTDEMPATAMHTIYVPRGERATWLVEEGDLSSEYDEMLYSNDDLTTFNFDGLYKPMSETSKAIVLRSALASDPS